MSTWHALLSLAIRCPSPHNVQPWRVRVVDDATAELFLQKSRTLPAEDVTGSFLLLTMGLFLEALTVLAAHRGHALRHELAHPPDWYRADHLAQVDLEMLPFATLHLSPDPALRVAPDFDEAAFLARRTSRLPYAPDPLAPDPAAELAALAQTFGQRFGTVRDPALIEQLLAWNTEAVFEDLNAAGYHDEITAWFRLDDRTSQRHRDGLDARCMGQPPIELLLVRHAPRLLEVPGLRSLFAARYRRQIGPVATLAYLAGGFWDPRDAFVAGRALIHFWVAVTRLGLSIHPYGNLVTNRPIAARVAQAIDVPDAWLIFKLGRSPEAPESYRRSVEEVLL